MESRACNALRDTIFGHLMLNHPRALARYALLDVLHVMMELVIVVQHVLPGIILQVTRGQRERQSVFRVALMKMGTAAFSIVLLATVL